jgi:multidrug efflux pump subunit AcrA (membrane-fusion protein)
MDVPGSDQKLKAGMYANVQLTLEKKDGVLIVPSDSIQYNDDEVFIYIVRDEKSVKVPVETGISMNGFTEILPRSSSSVSVEEKDLKKDNPEEGDLIVVEGQNLLEDGTSVRVVRSLDAIFPDIK